MHKPLYQIANEFISVYEEIMEMEEDLSEKCIQDTIQANKFEFEECCINLSSIVKNMENDLTAIKEYEKNIKYKKQKMENKIDKLKLYIKGEMERCNIKKINSIEFDVSIRNNPHSVDIFNEMNIPEDYVEIVEVKKIDKNKIKEDIKNGIDVKGAKLVQTTSLCIK